MYQQINNEHTHMYQQIDNEQCVAVQSTFPSKLKEILFLAGISQALVHCKAWETLVKHRLFLQFEFQGDETVLVMDHTE